jgi:hypothetical protein
MARDRSAATPGSTSTAPRQQAARTPAEPLWWRAPTCWGDTLADRVGALTAIREIQASGTGSAVISASV